MRPKKRAANAVPPDLATYDHERWARYAEAHPQYHAYPQPLPWRPHEHYEAALAEAGVDGATARNLGVAATMVDIRHRLADDARRGG